MGTTLQLNLTAVRDIAARVTGAGTAIAALSMELRIAPGAPSTDSTTRSLSDQLHETALGLSYVAEAAADELQRANEAVLEYAFNAAAFVRRTELAIIGLDVDDLIPHYYVSARRPARQPRDAQRVPLPSLDVDHRALGEAVLLASGAAEPAHVRIETARLRAAAETLHDCARGLRTAVTRGERPAATFDRFGSWLEDDYLPALETLDDNRSRWAAAYGAARANVCDDARSYRKWLARAAAGGVGDMAAVNEMAAHVRTALREYALTPLSDVACRPHPQLGARGD